MTEEHLKVNAYLITISDETESVFLHLQTDVRTNQIKKVLSLRTSEHWQVMNNQQTVMVTHY